MFYSSQEFIADIKFSANERMFMMFFNQNPLKLSDKDQGFRVLNADNLDELVVTTNWLVFTFNRKAGFDALPFITKEQVRSRLQNRQYAH